MANATSWFTPFGKFCNNCTIIINIFILIGYYNCNVIFPGIKVENKKNECENNVNCIFRNQETKNFDSNTNTQASFIDTIAKNRGSIIDKHHTIQLLAGSHPIRHGLELGIMWQTSNYGLSKRETLVQTKAYSHIIDTYNTSYVRWDYGDIYYFDYYSCEYGV